MIGAHVRAKYADSAHFLPGIITKVVDNGEDAHVIFTCDKTAGDEDLAEARVVSKKFIMAIEDPELINKRFTDDEAGAAA